MAIDYEDNHWIETYTGVKFYVTSPATVMIKIEDIAHSLSMQCRYSGHCRKFYSVAEHCIRVAEFVEPDIKLAALLHDAAEAYVGDLVRGVKSALPEFRVLEDRIQSVVHAWFNISITRQTKAAIKEADDTLCATEARDLMNNTDDWISSIGYKPLPDTIIPMSQPEAKANFIRAFKRYCKGG